MPATFAELEAVARSLFDSVERRGDALVSDATHDSRKVAPGSLFIARRGSMPVSEHLDYHGTPEHYYAAKATLFTEAFTDQALICTDDRRSRAVGALFRPRARTCWAGRESPTEPANGAVPGKTPSRRGDEPG